MRLSGKTVHCGERARHLSKRSLVAKKPGLSEEAIGGAREQHHNGRETKGYWSSRSAQPSENTGLGSRRLRGNRLPRRSRTDAPLHH